MKRESDMMEKARELCGPKPIYHEAVSEGVKWERTARQVGLVTWLLEARNVPSENGQFWKGKSRLRFHLQLPSTTGNFQEGSHDGRCAFAGTLEVASLPVLLLRKVLLYLEYLEDSLCLLHPLGTPTALVYTRVNAVLSQLRNDPQLWKK